MKVVTIDPPEPAVPPSGAARMNGSEEKNVVIVMVTSLIYVDSIEKKYHDSELLVKDSLTAFTVSHPKKIPGIIMTPGIVQCLSMKRIVRWACLHHATTA